MGVYTPDLPLVLCHIFRLLASGEFHRYSGEFCWIFYGGMYTICRHLRIVLRRFCLRLPGVPTLRGHPFIMGFSRQVFLLDTQKEPKRCPLLPTAREARPRGYSPLGTPKLWSRSKKAKKRRSAAFFFTLFHFSPFDPSGAKFYSTTHSVGADARHRPAPGRRQLMAVEKRPPCVKGAVSR